MKSSRHSNTSSSVPGTGNALKNMAEDLVKAASGDPTDGEGDIYTPIAERVRTEALMTAKRDLERVAAELENLKEIVDALESDKIPPAQQARFVRLRDVYLELIRSGKTFLTPDGMTDMDRRVLFGKSDVERANLLASFVLRGELKNKED